jgi:hypothetical protein
MTVPIKQGTKDASRRIRVYQIRTSWHEVEVTSKRRRTSTYRRVPGGDLGTKLTEQNVSNVPGTRVAFDITPLVQQAVSGALGSSRYTRVALVDPEGSTSASWRALTASCGRTSSSPAASGTPCRINPNREAAFG